MHPPHSTISQSCASSTHTKDAPSTHTTFTAKAESNKHSSAHNSEVTVRRSGRHRTSISIRSRESDHTGSEHTVIPLSPRIRSRTRSRSKASTSARTRTEIEPTPSPSPHPPTKRTKIRRRKTHHRNISRTTSTPSLSSLSTTTRTASSRTTSSRTRSSSSPPPYSLHAPTSKRSKNTRIPSRLQPPRMARTLATLDDLGALLFFRLPLYLGRRKTVYVLDDLGIWGFCRPLRKLGLLYERVEERWWTWRDWR